jgi:hypothetical protein
MARTDWDLEAADYYEGIPPDDYAEYLAYLATLDVNNHPPVDPADDIPAPPVGDDEPPF